MRFAASKLTEDDSLVLEALNLDEKDKEACEKIISQMENETGMDRQAALADMRFSFIERLCSEFVSKPEETIGQKISAEADKILTGKYTALIAFLGIMALIFYITFGPLGSFTGANGNRSRKSHSNYRFRFERLWSESCRAFAYY